MESKSYEFDGKLIVLTEDEISAINKTNEVGTLGIDVAVILKDENTVHGTIVRKEYLYPTDYSEFPLWTKVAVETKDGYTAILHFNEIESYKLKN